MKKMKVFFYSLRGRRETNEDTHKIVANGKNQNKNKSCVNFFGIYDGHGGKRVSEFLKDKVADTLLDKKNPHIKYPLTKSIVDTKFNEIQEELRNNKFSFYSGSTCLNVIHFKKNGNIYLNVINLGDCRAVLCSGTRAVPLTVDHKPNFPEERSRIEKLGGKIVKDGVDYRIKDLSVSRAFGDADSAPFVTHIPDLYKYKLNKTDKFLIMGCDGLWDVLSNQDAINFVIDHSYNKDLDKIVANTNVAKKLAEYAYSIGSTDNISVIVFFF